MGKKNNKKQTTAAAAVAPTKKATTTEITQISKVTNDKSVTKDEATANATSIASNEVTVDLIGNSDVAGIKKASVNVDADANGTENVDQKVLNTEDAINNTAEPIAVESISAGVIADLTSNVDVSKESKTDVNVIDAASDSTQLHSKLLADMDQSALASDVSESKLLSEVEEMESLCMNCHANGITRFMMHKIPYFRELIIASFRCEECGEYNNEVTFGGEIQIQGCHYELNITKPADLDRQLIKSDSATIKIPNIDFEIPPATQKGEISTIEGFLLTASKNLSLYQIERMADNPVVGEKVQDIIDVLDQMASGNYLPFRIMVDDPSGNSFIQNPYAPTKDPQMKIGFYFRTPEQDISLGLQPVGQKEGGAQGSGVYKDDKDSNFKALITGPGFGQVAGISAASGTNVTTDTAVNGTDCHVDGTDNSKTPSHDITTQHIDNGSNSSSVYESESSVRLGRSEVVSIPSPCPNCGAPGESLTALTDIPHFKEMIIMAFDCQLCGYKNSEIRGGGAVPTVGTQVSLKVLCTDDLKRDVLKSDSAMVLILELELELSHGTLGGIFTTVEGLLNKISKNLIENNPFAIGDSTTLHHSTSTAIPTMKAKFATFLDALEIYAKGQKFPFTLILRDPLGNSFISAPLGSFLAPEDDHNIVLEDFVRSFDENEEFGLNDINTRDYETGMDEATYHDIVLADRLTQPVRKTVDHPTFFAKGIEDSTPGGQCFTSGSSGVSDSSVTGSGGVNCSRNWSTQGEREIPESYYKNLAASTAANNKDKQKSITDADINNTAVKAEEAVSEFYSPPAGWAALKPGEDHTFGQDGDEEEEEEGNKDENKMDVVNDEEEAITPAAAPVVVESPVVRIVKEVTVVEQITNNKPFSTDATSPTITAPTTLTTSTTLTTITTAKSAAVTSATTAAKTITTTNTSTDIVVPPSVAVTVIATNNNKEDVSSGNVIKSVDNITTDKKDKHGDNHDDGYIASATFTGSRLGYVYKIGDQGVGYYKDHSVAVSATAVASAIAEVKQQQQQQQVAKKQKQGHSVEASGSSNGNSIDHNNTSSVVDEKVNGIISEEDSTVAYNDKTTNSNTATDDSSSSNNSNSGNNNNDKAKSFIRYSLDRPVSATPTTATDNNNSGADNNDGDDNDNESKYGVPKSIVYQVTSSYGIVTLASVTAVVAVALVMLLRKR